MRKQLGFRAFPRGRFDFLKIEPAWWEIIWGQEGAALGQGLPLGTPIKILSIVHTGLVALVRDLVKALFMPEYTTPPGKRLDRRKADLIVGQILTGIPLPKPRKWLKGSQLWTAPENRPHHIFFWPDGKACLL